MELPRQLDFPKRLVTQILDDDVPELAAGLSYRFLFAIFPFLIFVAALAAFVAQAAGLGDPTPEIMGSIGDNLPPQVAEELTPQIQAVLGQTRPGLLSLGAILALWAATGAIGSLQKAMNKAYDVPETRNFVVKTGGAVLLTLLASAGILVAFVTIVGGSLLTQEVVKALGIPPGTWDVVALARWPLVLVLVALAVAVLLKFAPNVSVSFRWTVVGGVAFAVGWLVATALFALYVANFANYSNTYGALGGVIVLMLWFYLTAVLLLAAAELTSLLVKSHEPHKVEARRREIQQGQEALSKPGPTAGAVVGVLGPVAPDDAKQLRPAGRPQPPLLQLPVPIAYRAPDARPRGPSYVASSATTRLIALALLAVGAVTGAIAGVLARDDAGSTRA